MRTVHEMKALSHFLLIGVLLMGLGGCKKDFHPGDTIEVVDTVSAVHARTFDTIQGFGIVPIGTQSAGWDPANTLLVLPIPISLNTGDSLIATVQVLLQRNDRDPSDPDYDCERDSLSVAFGTFLRATQGVAPPSALEPVQRWRPGATDGEWIKPFTLITRIRADSDMPAGAVIQVFVKVWPEVGCTPFAGATCHVLSRSLALTVVHP